MRISIRSILIATLVSLLGAPAALSAPAATDTTLTPTPTGTQPSGTPVTLTATVKSNSAAVPKGTVQFCAGTPAAQTPTLACSGHLLLGRVQISDPTQGTAMLDVRPPVGTNKYYAIFLPQGATLAESVSAAATVTVDQGKTATIIGTQTGTAGNYSVPVTVDGFGSRTAPTGTVTLQDESNNFAEVKQGTLANPAQPTFNLGQPTLYSAFNSRPNRAVAADFTKDGIPDMAILNGGYPGVGLKGNTVTVYIGQKDGTMKLRQPVSQFAISAGETKTNDAVGLAVGDFNNNGALDLAIYLATSLQVVILPDDGTGTGGFAAAEPGVASKGVVGAAHGALVTGDFDGDGLLDVVVGNGAKAGTPYTMGNIVFLKGDGNYGLTAGAPITSVQNPSAIAATDLNGDGLLDLVVAEDSMVATSDIGKLTSLLGAGTGGFAAAPGGWTQTTGNYPTGITVDDLNGDGTPDVAVANAFDHTLTLFFARATAPDGTFPNNTTIANAAPNGGAASVASADFNLDGATDLAVADGKSSLNVLLGSTTQKGTFAAPISVTAAAGTFFVGTADFDGDGVADLYAANITDNNVEIVPTILSTSASVTIASVSVLGTGTHNIVASYGGDTLYRGSVSTNSDQLTAQQITTTTALASPSSAVEGGSVTLTATVSPNTASGVTATGNVQFFATPTQTPQTPVQIGPNVALGPNGIATLTTTINLPIASYTLTAKYSGDNNFAGSTSAPPTPFSVTPPAPHTNTALVITAPTTGTQWTLTATVKDPAGNVKNGTVRFCPALAAHCTEANMLGERQLTAAGTAAMDAALIGGQYFIAEFLGTVSDLASASPVTYAQPADKSNTSGKYLTSTAMPVPTQTQAPYTLTANVTSYVGIKPSGTVDFSDPKLPYTYGSSTLGTPQAPAFGYGLSIPGFGSNPATVVQPPSNPVAIGNKASSIAVGDFDNDKTLDLLATDPTDGKVTVLKGGANQTFTPFSVSPFSQPGAQFVVTADFNNDGNLDFVVAKGGAPFGLIPYLGNGTDTNTFADQTPVTVADAPWAIAVQDFDGDGLLDLAVVSKTGNNVVVLQNKSTASVLTFAPFGGSPYAMPAGSLPLAIAAADFDQDGNVDLAVADWSGQTIGLLKGKGGGAFEQPTTQALNPVHKPNSLAVSDFNGDGVLDLATANSDATVSVFTGRPGSLVFTQADVTVTNGELSAGIAAADFDNDGNQDLTVSDSTKNFVTVLLNIDGTGTFPATAHHNAAPATGATAGGFVAIGDFYKDGLPDIIMAYPQSTAAPNATIFNPMISATATATLTGVSPIGVAASQVYLNAAYQGNDSYLPSNSNINGASTGGPPVVGGPVQLTLTLSPPPQPVTSASGAYPFQAQLTPVVEVPGHPFSGTIQMLNDQGGGSLPMGSPFPVNLQGAGSYATQSNDLQFGPNSITATYTGDPFFTAAPSNALPIRPSQPQLAPEPTPGAAPQAEQSPPVQAPPRAGQKKKSSAYRDK